VLLVHSPGGAKEKFVEKGMGSTADWSCTTTTCGGVRFRSAKIKGTKSAAEVFKNIAAAASRVHVKRKITPGRTRRRSPYGKSANINPDGQKW